MPLFKLPADILCIVIQGKGLLRIDHEVLPLQPGDAFFLRPSMLLEVILESSHADCYILMPSRVTLSRQRGQWKAAPAEAETPLLPPGKLTMKASRSILEQAHQLYHNSRDRSKPAGAGELQLQFQSLIASILRDLPEQGLKEEASQGIDLSIQYMYNHFREKLKLDTLSQIAGLTQTSYSRSFKKAKGVSPVEYLNRIRIDYSKQVLNQEGSIKEVSEMVGFRNEFYFSRMFKRETGITPTLYMQRKQLKVAVATCYRYQDNLRSLGVDAAAVMNCHNYGERSETEHRQFIQDQLNDLRQARPDLILADFRHVPFYEQLKQIAPTVVLDYTMDWRKTHRRIAELVGREKEAQHNFAQLEQKIHYTRHRLADTFGKETISVLRLYPDKIRVQGSVGHPLNELLYSELGLKPGSIVSFKEQNKEFPLASLPPFETDHLFIYKYYLPDQDEQVQARLQQSVSWTGMQAYRSSQIRIIGNWISSSWAPVGQSRIMDELLDL